MNYCPNCGNKLTHTIKVENKPYKQCSCGYIDWNNWVNVSAVVVARNLDDEILMVRIKKSKTYTFPGGFRDLGETLEEAAKRECFEETGYDIDQLKLIHVDTLDSDRLVWVVFEAKIIGGNFIENQEVDHIEFVKKTKLKDIYPLRGPLSKRLRDLLIKK